MSEQTGAAMLQGPDGIVVSVEPYGPDEATLEHARAALGAGVLHKVLGSSRHRWLDFCLDDGDGGGLPAEPQRFTATLYDYPGRRTLELAGDLADLAATEVTVSGRQPNPTREEFLEAVAVLSADPVLGPALRDRVVLAYQPMPPLVTTERPDGRSERVIAVGLALPPGTPLGGLPSVLGGHRHRLLGVDLLSEEVVVPAHGPSGAEADHDCGGPVDDSCALGGQSGQALVTLRRGPDELWRMLVVRPAASSGTNGSGVELRHVSFRGRSVLRRAHVPILNVEYQGATPNCGPAFRDWLDEEACFQAEGTDVAPGFRVCDERPQTIIESGTDTGNFRGVAVHMDGPDLLLTSELRAGWYRYITEWRLRPDGSIRPRMGFSAVLNFCTCQLHIHHAYWRLDWALTEPGDHRIEELNDPSELGLEPESQTFRVERSRLRDEARRRRWRISHRASGLGYLLVPGPEDGEADLYGAGDVWFLRHHPDEIDDGQPFANDRVRSRARLDLFADAEWIDGEDVVTWYAGHWDHAPGFSGAYLGPELQPLEPARGRGHVRLDVEETQP